VLRAGLLRFGEAMLGEALSADPGYRGPRADCGHGNEAVFAGHREKVVDTALGPVALRRAWYHCADWPRATMSSASRARRCRPAWPR
jgi:hypothetical protein